MGAREKQYFTFGTVLLSCDLYAHKPGYQSARPLIQT